MVSEMKTVELRETIHVTENEREVFDLLLRAVHSFGPDTNLRVAGGWVRDKLLGQDSNDIDITIGSKDNKKIMKPGCFLSGLKSYLRSQGEEEVHGNVITSRHNKLKIVKMRVFNQSIDITQVKFGTPEQDAYRRDLTINSLFYNIHTGLVEDFSGRGVDDLKCGRLATPLPAQVTLLEDPLRVLRAIRLGARFGFTLDEQLKNAASSEEIKLALDEKVSRERIGNEIDLMITGNRPVSALTYLSDLKLFGFVFALPSSLSEPAPSGSLCVAYIKAMWNLIQTLGIGNFSCEERRYALYAALLLPFRNMVYKDTKGKLIPVVNYIFIISLKRSRNDTDKVLNIHRAAGRFLSLILPLQLKYDEVQVLLDKREWEGTDVIENFESIYRNDPDLPLRSKIRVLAGFLLRDIKKVWRVTLLTSLLLYRGDNNNLNFQLDKKREMYVTILGTIRELGLDTIWDLKPLVDGSDIAKALQLSYQGGPIIREWQHKLLTWQLAYPNGMPLRTKTICKVT